MGQIAIELLGTWNMCLRVNSLVCTTSISLRLELKAFEAKELVHELSEYLSRKFPQTYRAHRKKPRGQDFGWYGQGEIDRIEIVPLKATYYLDIDDPMMVSGLLYELLTLLHRSYLTGSSEFKMTLP